ncbi:twitching motility protein PilT [Methylomonas methanica]|uniref:Twitching motility protein PilT n=1 Tax=Methylomonas methanica TaxID=421 RepID=A0A177LYX1_METMH|nr:type II toxin-antitoxin system VapC family toxin [Methylomonas methanica]OAH98483.1 twitching motility protein PilT [Methylomonas methanica]
MKALLDTHALLWWLDGDEKLSRIAKEWIAEPSHVILVSAASAWEIATKVRIGKLPGAEAVVDSFQDCLKEQGFTPLAITTDHALRAGCLPGPHRDPFDRMLIAQAQAENIALISNEALFDSYGVRRIW